MKETVKISRTVGYFEKIYRALNADKFNNALEMPMITIQSSKGAYGHVTCSRIWNRKDEQCFELNIGAEYLNRPIENVVSTILHEMVHIYNLMNNIQDCSRNNTYHNKKFKEKAEEVGLHIDYDKKIGWSITTPTEELIEYIIEKGWSDVLVNRGTGFSCAGTGASGGKSGTSPDDTPARKPSSTRKLVCPNCGCTCRTTKDISIICGECYYSAKAIVDMIKAV